MECYLSHIPYSDSRYVPSSVQCPLPYYLYKATRCFRGVIRQFSFFFSIELFMAGKCHKLHTTRLKNVISVMLKFFVVKTLSEEELQITETKIRSVLDFAEPVITKQLKSFWGLVNYFSDFIRNQSSIVHSLHQLLLHYNKQIKKYGLLKLMLALLYFTLIWNCSKHWKDHAPRCLQTDVFKDSTLLFC